MRSNINHTLDVLNFCLPNLGTRGLHFYQVTFRFLGKVPLLHRCRHEAGENQGAARIGACRYQKHQPPGVEWALEHKRIHQSYSDYQLLLLITYGTSWNKHSLLQTTAGLLAYIDTLGKNCNCERVSVTLFDDLQYTGWHIRLWRTSRLTSKHKSCIGLARPGQTRPKRNLYFEVHGRFWTSGMVAL